MARRPTASLLLASFAAALVGSFRISQDASLHCKGRACSCNDCNYDCIIDLPTCTAAKGFDALAKWQEAECHNKPTPCEAKTMTGKQRPDLHTFRLSGMTGLPIGRSLVKMYENLGNAWQRYGPTLKQRQSTTTTALRVEAYPNDAIACRSYAPSEFVDCNSNLRRQCPDRCGLNYAQTIATDSTTVESSIATTTTVITSITKTTTTTTAATGSADAESSPSTTTTLTTPNAKTTIMIATDSADADSPTGTTTKHTKTITATTLSSPVPTTTTITSKAMFATTAVSATTSMATTTTTWTGTKTTTLTMTTEAEAASATLAVDLAAETLEVETAVAATAAVREFGLGAVVRLVGLAVLGAIGLGAIVCSIGTFSTVP